MKGRSVDALTVHRTDEAVLLRLLRQNSREVWVPLSQLDEDPPAVNRRGVVVIPLWLCEREDIADDPDDEDGDDPIVVFNCPPRPRPVVIRRVHSTAFGDGVLVEDKGDRVVVDFPAPLGRKTMLKTKVTVQ